MFSPHSLALQRVASMPAPRRWPRAGAWQMRDGRLLNAVNTNIEPKTKGERQGGLWLVGIPP